MAADDQTRIEVTDDNLGELLIEGLEEALTVRRGEGEPARRVRRRMTAREATVRAPNHYSGAAIQRIREEMGLSQRMFAEILNASSETVKAWEQGKRQPDGMALALLEVAERHPDALMERLRRKSA